MQTLYCALLAFISLTAAQHQYFFQPLPYPVFVYHQPAPLPVVRFVREPFHGENEGFFRAKPNKIPAVPILGMDVTSQPVRTTKKTKTTKQPTVATTLIPQVVILHTTTVQPTNALNAEQPVNTSTIKQPANTLNAEEPINTTIAKQPANILNAEQPVNASSGEQPANSIQSTQQPSEQPTLNSTQQPSTEQPSVPFAPLLPYEEEDYSKNNATGTAPDSMGGVVFAAFSVPSRRPAGGISFG